MMRVPSFQKQIKTFSNDTSGGLTVEAILVLPFLVWALVGTFMAFDAFRAQGVNLKATYTIADTLSREQNTVDQNYINGLNQVFDFLTTSPFDTEVRVTAVTFVEGDEDDPGDDRHRIDWSATSSSRAILDDMSLALIADEIPIMADGDQILIVETWMTHRPTFQIGIPETEMANLMVIRPRFVPQLRFDADAPVTFTSGTGVTRSSATSSETQSSNGSSGSSSAATSATKTATYTSSSMAGASGTDGSAGGNISTAGGNGISGNGGKSGHSGRSTATMSGGGTASTTTEEDTQDTGGTLGTSSATGETADDTAFGSQ